MFALRGLLAATSHSPHELYNVVGLISAQTSMQVRKITSSTASAYALQRGIANYFSPGFLYKPFSTPYNFIPSHTLQHFPRQTMAEHPTPPQPPLSPDAGPTDP